MRKVLLVVLALLVAGSAAAGTGTVRSHLSGPAKITVSAEGLSAKLVAAYGAQALAVNNYVGSTWCMACHTEDAATFYDTQHSYALIRPMTQYTLIPRKGVLANTLNQKVDDFMAGLDFNAVTSVLDPYKPNAPKLSVKSGVYTVTINGVDMPVASVRQQMDREGNWIQRYLVKIPVTDQATGKAGAAYLAGIQYETDGNKWVLDGIEDAYTGNTPKVKPSMTTADAMSSGLESFDRNCIGCHVSGIRSLASNDKGETVFTGYFNTLADPSDPNVVDYNLDGNFETVNIGCESCHGPGAQHILATTDADRKAKIVNPANLPQAEQLAVCGQCHSRLKSLPGKVYSWPMNDSTGEQWTPGKGPMEPWISENFSKYPDGVNARGTHSTWNEAIRPTTLHYNNPYDKMTCWTCHTLHRKVAPSQTRTSITDAATKLRIPTDYRKNTLCLACHATHGPFTGVTKEQVAKYDENKPLIASVTEAHTHHPYGPERDMGLSRCTGCHMPYKGLIPGTNTYYVAGHTWEAIPPEKTLKYQDPANPDSKGAGMPNSCAVQCHNEKVNIFGMGIETNPPWNKWNSTFDTNMAKVLVKYYGPAGTWWDTTPKP